MRKIWILISLIVILLMFQGCGRSEEGRMYGAPNWTQDNRVCFLEHHYVEKYRNTLWTDEPSGGEEEIWVCEINSDGTGKERIKKVIDNEFSGTREYGMISSSSAGNWIVFNISELGEESIYVVNRDSSGLEMVKEGRNPDFSPDASQIVYEKPNQGIWIMDRDGGNDRQIISDADARYPAWSPDIGRIAFTISQSETLKICNTSGSIVALHTPLEGGWYEKPDWGPSDTNAVIADVNGRNRSEIIYLNPESILTINFLRYPKWSPNGEKFIGYDGSWFVINRNGTNKWYLQP